MYEQSAKLPSTSSGRLTRSGKKRRLETEISRLEEKLRFTKRMLAVPALLEEMNPHDLKTFQSFLTSGLLPDCPPIPESQLENADRQVTVDQMVKTYGPERALKITLRILRGMKRVDLAEKLETDHRGGNRTRICLIWKMNQNDLAEKLERDQRSRIVDKDPNCLSIPPPIFPSISPVSPSFSGTASTSPLCGYPPRPPFLYPGSSEEVLSLTSAGSSGNFISQRPQILSGSALLLTTPEELTEEQLTNDELLSVLSIPESQLENADIQVTVDQMERYDSLRAMEITETFDRYHSRGKKRRTNEPPSWPGLVSRDKKSEEDCVPLTDG
ncbi:caspase b-like, partial [Coregonus clupeaformis]|uniref:caspase b-like n=1 Tax=Coregonus clupeaformis TaxID=59861 RepID=UPI001E1C8557